MNIRAWFGRKIYYAPGSITDMAVDGLLDLYAQAMSKYFSLNIPKNVNELIKLARNQGLSTGEKLFLDWFEAKGLPLLIELANSNLPEDPDFVAQIDYEKYILECEMDFQYPEDVRSCLINIVDDMPERLEGIQKPEYFFELSYTDYNDKKEIKYDPPKLEESGSIQTLLSIC